MSVLHVLISMNLTRKKCGNVKDTCEDLDLNLDIDPWFKLLDFEQKCTHIRHVCRLPEGAEQ